MESGDFENILRILFWDFEKLILKVWEWKAEILRIFWEFYFEIFEKLILKVWEWKAEILRIFWEFYFEILRNWFWKFENGKRRFWEYFENFILRFWEIDFESLRMESGDFENILRILFWDFEKLILKVWEWKAEILGKRIIELLIEIWIRFKKLPEIYITATAVSTWVVISGSRPAHRLAGFSGKAAEVASKVGTSYGYRHRQKSGLRHVRPL